ncbi:MAG: glycoside hydrolase family 127 protein [Paludibacter sp.]|nr:glycoside hydrolase family 127 protein [Paludibacter sp.]
MKKSTFLYFLLIVFQLAAAQPKVKLFPLKDVRLLSGAFQQAQNTDKQYLLALDADKLLSPYLREAGLSPKAESYGNWENTGLDGHIGGHYVSALDLMLASTGDKEIEKRFDYMISELKRCQDHLGTGYLGGVPGGVSLWNDVAAGKIQAGSFDLNKKWVPLYNIHKIYAGLRDAWLHTGNLVAKEMLINMSEWFVKLVQNLTDEQIQTMLRSEHGGLNEVFADVAVITGDAKYLKLAHQFSHQYLLQPLLKKEDKLTGMHANTQIPKVIGFKRIAEVENKTEVKSLLLCETLESFVFIITDW